MEIQSLLPEPLVFCTDGPWMDDSITGSEPVKDEHQALGFETQLCELRFHCESLDAPRDSNSPLYFICERTVRASRHMCRPPEIMFSESHTPPRSCSPTARKPPIPSQLMKISGAQRQQRQLLMLFLRRWAKIRSQPGARNGGGQAGEGHWK